MLIVCDEINNPETLEAIKAVQRAVEQQIQEQTAIDPDDLKSEGPPMTGTQQRIEQARKQGST